MVGVIGQKRITSGTKSRPMAISSQAVVQPAEQTGINLKKLKSCWRHLFSSGCWNCCALWI